MQSILGNSRKSDITFHCNGRICIAARVAKLLNLQHGDVIDILNGEGEYYLVVKHHAPVIGRHEGMIYRSNKQGNHCLASSTRLCRYILDECHAAEHIKLCCGELVTLPIYGLALPIIIKYRL